MIGGGGSPSLEAVVIVVFGTAFVGFNHQLLGGTLRDGMDLAKTFDAFLVGTGDKDVDTTGILTKDIVGTTAYEQAGFFFGQATDDVTLHLEQGIVAQAVGGRHSAIVDKGKTHAEQSTDNALRSLFVSLLEEFTAEAAFFGG